MELAQFHVFISHASEDIQLAKALYTCINNTFKGRILPYLLHQEIRGGEQWNNTLKTSLNNCQAIVSLMTPLALSRPWLFVEWAGFWLGDKFFYILVIDEKSQSQLIHPMIDRHVTHLLQRESVKAFFKGLAYDAGDLTIPNGDIDDFIEAVQKIITSSEYQESRQGRQPSSLLYEEDSDVKAVLASWIEDQSQPESLKVEYEHIDHELHLKPGSTKHYIQDVAKDYDYTVKQEGKRVLLLHKHIESYAQSTGQKLSIFQEMGNLTRH